MNLRHLIDFNDMSTTDWNMLYNLTCDIIKAPEKYAAACKGTVLATLFYEPSTRTQFSFQTAMLRLGGNVIGFADPNSSSVSKGESLRDTVKIVSGYADIMVMRNPLDGAAYAASLYSPVPIINAGDGAHLHPTQTMTDMFTIYNEKGTYENLNIGLCGDLFNGRTVHSFIKAFSRYKNNRFWLISTKELMVPGYVYETIENTDNEIITADNLEECIGELDILYMTRIQRERFKTDEEYKTQAGIYILNKSKMEKAKPNMIVMHPLPKVDEIFYDVDDDPRAIYFKQARNGMYVRMALILLLCEANRERYTDLSVYPLPQRQFCNNQRCISNKEIYLPELIKDSACVYCEHKLT
ncbi:MAG: aspartate carbamoyltransferase [Oscillospiraceae bacterium]|nr:aspartate carbamoyltransferase [Oscillospiraceae bacterium]